MPIRVQCASCQQVIQAKEEFAGRKVRCPGCREVITLPDLETEEDISAEFELPPPRTGRAAPAAKKKSKRRSSSDAPWYRRHWHWLVALSVIVLAPIPKLGLGLAAVVAFVGMGMALIGGIVPFLRIIFTDPGTVLTMLVSRSARFDMMRQPDDHPYKVLVRTAFNPTRGLFWRGVLLVVVFIPAAFIYGAAGEFFRMRGAAAAAPPPPPAGMRPGLAREVPQQQQAAPLEAPVAPFRPPVAQPQRPDSTVPYQAEIVYDNFRGEGTPTEAVQRVLGRFPALVEGTLEIDEASRTIRFQTRGAVNPALFTAVLSKAGFGSLKSTAKPASNN